MKIRYIAKCLANMYVGDHPMMSKEIEGSLYNQSD